MTANQGNGKYVIDPRKFRRDRFYFIGLVLFALIWIPMTAVVTYLAITERHPFFFVWLIFGYLGTFLVPFALFNRNRKQVLEIAGESLVVHGTGVWPGSKVRIQKRNLHALTLEHYDDADRESVYTLNLMQKPGVRPRRIMLASFVHPRDKAILLEEIRVFLDRHGFVFNVKNEMAPMMNPENRTMVSVNKPPLWMEKAAHTGVTVSKNHPITLQTTHRM